jgi:hypothetical protein
MVTLACHRPSLPRYREDVVSWAVRRGLPVIDAGAKTSEVAVELAALDADGASDMDDVQETSGDLAFDAASRASQVSGYLDQSEQERALLRSRLDERRVRGGGGFHASQMPHPAPLVLTTTPRAAPSFDWTRLLHTPSV